MTMVLGRCLRTIDIKQYSMDHSEGFSVLEHCITRGVRIRLIFDRDKFWSPSCVRQNDRIRTLAEVASDEQGSDELFQVRVLKPTIYGPGGFNSQHSKTWILDGELYIDGSANFTGQSMRNEESVLATRIRSVVRDAAEVFDGVWERATVVPLCRLLTLPEHRERSVSQASRRSASLAVVKRF